MKRPLNLEHTIGPWLEEAAAPRTPPYVPDMLTRIERTRQRPAWLVPALWLEADPATGASSTLRRAAIVATLLLLTLAFAGAALVGSGVLEPRRPIGTLDVVAAAPWQAEPMEVGADLASLMDAACLAAIHERENWDGVFRVQEPVRWWIDVRGGQLITAMYGDRHVIYDLGRPRGGAPRFGRCWAKVEPGQPPVVEMLGYSPPASSYTLHSNVQHVFQWNYGVPWVGHTGDDLIPAPITDASGHVSSDVARVVILLEDGQRVEATVGYGWFGAWWPARGSATDPQFVHAVSYEAFDADGRVLAEGPVPPPHEDPKP